MPTIIIGIVLLAVLFLAMKSVVKRTKTGGGCCGEREAEETVKVKDKNKSHYPHTTTLHISGMTCESCGKRVQNTLNRMEDTWATEVDFAGGTATVLTKGRPDTAAMKQQIAQAGYTVLRVEKS